MAIRYTSGQKNDMCAINGFTFKDEALAEAMNAATRHRGPDGSRVWSDEGITFGHNRLRIIDVSTNSDQPMKSKDGRYSIVYNGELYNFRELKKEIGEDGFRTTGDTEVILEAYAKWGKDCVGKFNGMFAFAIWDAAKEELFLARDHMGIKPLFYAQIGDRLIFSSEMKGILAHRQVTRKISRESLNHYLRLLYVPEPLTILESVHKFPKGSFGIFKQGSLEIEQYFKPEIGKLSQSKKTIVQTIETKIDESVKRQLVSDRPLGIYLSGGIDSTVILDSMSKQTSNIKTFSVGFDPGPGEDASKYNQDMLLAKKTASLYGTNHHEVFLSSGEVLKIFDEVIWHMDEPISNPTAWAQFVLSERTKPDATVVLCGDGGDELFGGYERYRLGYAASLYQILPKPFTDALSRLSPTFRKLSKRDWGERYAQFMFQKDDVVSRVLSDRADDPHATEALISRYMNGTDFEECSMETDRQTWLPDFALRLGDEMSMAHGVEARVPLLDKDVVEYALRIPARKKVSLFETKRLLRMAFKDRLPEYILHQPKRGFFAPAAKWLRHEGFLKLAREMLKPEYNEATRDLFDWKEIGDIFDRHVDKSVYNLPIIWAILTLQGWVKRFIPGETW